MITLKRILVATDFSEPSHTALVYARALARTFGARIDLLHVIENAFLRPMVENPHAVRNAAWQTLDACLTDEERKTKNARPVLETSDHTAAAIVEYAKKENVDLIVMGTEGRGTMSQVLVGSVAEHVVRMAPCPVLTVRQPEHEFVVGERAPSVGYADFEEHGVS
jgi:nucleotide-binding universal stress UspA family protein